MADTPTVTEISDYSIDKAKPLLAKLDDGQLAELRRIEVDKGRDKQRSGMIEAIDGEAKNRHGVPGTDALLEMTIDDARGHLAKMDDDALAALRSSEAGKDGGGRAGLLSAIDSEAKRRADEKGGDDELEDETPEEAGTAPAPEVPNDQAPAVPNTLQPPALSAADRRAVSAATESQDTLTAVAELFGEAARPTGTFDFTLLPGLVSNLQKQLSAAMGEAQRNADRIVALEQEKTLGQPREGTPLADVRHVVTKGAPGDMTLVFMEGTEEVLSVPPVQVEPYEFYQRGAETVIYQRTLSIGANGPSFRLSAVELRNGGDVVDRCPVIPPMEAGGGRAVELPEGTLVFRQPETVAADPVA